LPSASQLPIIVAMKICSRMNAGQGGEQSPRQHCFVNSTPLCSPRWAVSSGTPPTRNSADRPLRRGAACCARLSAAAPRRSLEVRLSNGPNRFRPTKKSCTEQTIKPCLSGARIAHRNPRFAPRPNRRPRPPATSHSPLAAVISNRELLVLESPQLIENTHRQPVLIENFEPNSASVLPAFVAAAFLPRGTKGRRAAFSLLEIPRKRSVEQGAA
jgi:hypothetical protein